MSEIVCVTNRKLCREDFLVRVERIAAAHPRRMILREKDLGKAEYADLAARIYAICQKHKVPLTLNGHPELAAQMGLSVQLGFAAAQAVHRQRFTEIGVSVHSVAEAASLCQCGASWLIAGHIWETACKAGKPGRGIDFLRAVVQASAVPVYAIGGVIPERMPQIQQVGAAGACLMSTLMTCNDPEQYLQELRQNGC